MEDSHICQTNFGEGLSLFGVFDGHGGKTEFCSELILICTVGQEVALYVKNHYSKVLSNLASFKAKNYKLALEESFMKIDFQMLTERGHQELMKL